MNDLRGALLRLVRAWRRADKLLDSYVKANIEDNPVRKIRDGISEAIVLLDGESEEDWDTSTTYAALTAPALSEEQRVIVLMAVYRRTHPEQPRPHVLEDDRFRNTDGYRWTGGEAR